MWNPWTVRCPACKADLQMSFVGKLSAILTLPLGLAYGGVPIYMEETRQWLPVESLEYFGITAPLLLAAGYLVWSRTKLLPRGHNPHSQSSE